MMASSRFLLYHIIMIFVNDNDAATETDQLKRLAEAGTKKREESNL
jgi:hypothetical protein